MLYWTSIVYRIGTKRKRDCTGLRELDLERKLFNMKSENNIETPDHLINIIQLAMNKLISEKLVRTNNKWITKIIKKGQYV